MEITEKLYVSDRFQWREWLADHFENSSGIWLVFPLKSSGEQGISYNDALYTPTYIHNDIYGFAKANQGCHIGTESVAIDPQFVGGNPFSYKLNGASLLLINDEYGLELGRYGDSKL